MTDKPLRDWRWLALGAGVVLALTVVAIVATIGLAAAFDVEFRALSRDPTEVYKGPVYAGWLSNLVTLLWQVPATCALLTAVVLRSVGRAGSAMFLTAGLIGAVLAADDLFLIHEFLAESFRLPELVLPILYGIALVAFMIVFRGQLGTAGIALVAVTVLLWTASIGSVVATQQHGQILASALKLAGVGFWTLLILRFAFVELRAAIGGAPAAEPANEEDDEDEDDEEEAEEPPPVVVPKPAKKKSAKKKAAAEPATVVVAAEPGDEDEADEEEPAAAQPEPVEAAPVPRPPAPEPPTEMQRVVPPLPARPEPARPDPRTEPETRPIPHVPADIRTASRPIVRPAPRPPVDQGMGRRPEPLDQRSRRPLDPGPAPQRPGPPRHQPPPQPPPPRPQVSPPTDLFAAQQPLPELRPPEVPAQPEAPPPTDLLPTQQPLPEPHPLEAPVLPEAPPPTELLPAHPQAPEPHPLAATPAQQAAAPPPATAADEEAPRHRRD